MKKKNFAIFVILLVISSGAMFLMSTNQVNGWGLSTHQFIVREASNIVPDDWKEAFTYYLPEIVSGSTYPDQVLQDWENHLYYPISGENNAPWHINNTIYGIKSNITNNEDWETIFWLLGIVSHYISDINIPVHTDEYWDGHPAYEKDINNHLNELNITIYSFDDFDDPVEFAIQCATYAHQ
ncbi:MAG: zinc dependent phospholipase C family protein [Candidatus Heimdallarchaeaceae archaeon]